VKICYFEVTQIGQKKVSIFLGMTGTPCFHMVLRLLFRRRMWKHWQTDNVTPSL